MMAVSVNIQNPWIKRFVILFLAMDYIVGFLFGYFCKYFITSLKDIATGKIFLHNYEYFDMEPLTEDDLP